MGGRMIHAYDVELAPEFSAADFLQQAASLSGSVGGQTLEGVGPQSLSIRRRHMTGLIWVLCIVLFPIGLLSLLFRPVETITVNAREADRRTLVSVSGTGDPRLVSMLLTLIGMDESGQRAQSGRAASEPAARDNSVSTVILGAVAVCVVVLAVVNEESVRVDFGLFSTAIRKPLLIFVCLGIGFAAGVLLHRWRRQTR